MRLLTNLIVSCTLLLTSISVTYPCVCVCDKPRSLRKEIKEADLIVIGRVLGMRDPDEDSHYVSSCGAYLVDVAIKETLKGKQAKTMVYVRDNIGTACDFNFPFRENEEYLLFVYSGEDDDLYLTGCSPSSRGFVNRCVNEFRRQPPRNDPLS
jgi:hypothetical protein